MTKDEQRKQPQADAAAARRELLAKVQAEPGYQKQWEPSTIRRIAKMTDVQVLAALAMTDEDIAAERARAAEASRHAPPTDDTPVRLWDHVDLG